MAIFVYLCLDIHDVDWTFGMTQNELCVAQGETKTFIKLNMFNSQFTTSGDDVNFKFSIDSGHNTGTVTETDYNSCSVGFYHYHHKFNNTVSQKNVPLWKNGHDLNLPFEALQ